MAAGPGGPARGPAASVCYHAAVRRVLLVDDSKAVRDALQAALDAYGFEIHHAANGAVALQQLAAREFDLAFVDLNMPVLDGPALVRMMRAQGIQTKVILVTVGASTPAVTATIKLGASEYIAKPFTPERIRVALARVLGLDPGALQIRPARVLVQNPDEGLADRMRAHLPAHVEVDAAPALTRVLQLAERRDYALVLLDAEVLEGEVATAALLLRQSLPGAAILALAGEAPPEARWSPEGALDGVLPRALDEALVHDFLYANFLRPLVFVEGAVVHAAGFEGDEQNLPAYFGALARALGRRCNQESAEADLCIDLTRVPPEPDRIAGVLLALRGQLEAVGAAPAFRVTEPVARALVARPDLGRTVIFS